MKKTVIIQKSASGRITFRAEMPGHLTRKEIRKECRKWCVELKGLIVEFR